MGLRDDDAQIFAERDLLDWARSAPSNPSSYDYPANEYDQAVYQSNLADWAKNKPDTGSGYDER